MSKPRDPVVVLLTYFQEADLMLAEQALALAQAIVKARRPKARPKPQPVKPPKAAGAAE